MANSDQPTCDKQRPKFNIRVLHMDRVQLMLERGEYVDGKLLAEGLRDHGNQPIPPDVLKYLCRFLEGKEKKRRGRKPTPEAFDRQMQMIMQWFYTRNLKWLLARKKHFGHLNGWPSIREADFWQGPPNEIAARMVARRFSYGAESWRGVQNQISSLK